MSSASPYSVAGGYISVPIDVDVDDIMAIELAATAAATPGWVPHEGNPDVRLLESFARMNAETAQVASMATLAIFGYIGSLFHISPIPGASASMTTTWTMADAKGYTIPQGTVIGYPVAGDNLVLFATQVPVTVLPGATTTASGGVTVAALTAGAAGNGLAPGTMTLVDSLVYVTGIVSASTSAGGSDPETQSGFLDRLSAQLALLTPRPILPGDFAVLAANIPGVRRALAIDGFDPASGTSGNQRLVAVAVVDANGSPLSPATQAQVQTYLDGLREVNFTVNVVAPTYTTVNVSFQAVCTSSANPPTVQAAVIAALSAYLSPANWGGGSLTPPVWAPTATTVRYLDVASVIHSVSGVDHIATLTIGTPQTSPGSADIILTTPAPLPQPGTVSGIVTTA